MVMQAQLHAAVAMAQQQQPDQRESIFLQQQLSDQQLQRWGSLTSVTSTCSSDWNDIGLPPLPLRQRSMSSPADAAPVPNPAALHHQQQQYLLACSMPEQQYLLEQQHSLQTCLSMGESGSLEALVYEAGLRHPGSCMPAADQDAQMLDGDTQPAWGTLSPSVLASAAAFARARRSQQALSTLHSSGSVSSTSSGSSSGGSQPLATQSSGRSERSVSYPGSSSCNVAMELCSSERSLYRMDSSLLRCHSVAASPKHPEAARLGAQELVVLSKLKAILSEQEQLASIEKQLRHKLVDEQASRAAAAAAAAGGSPRAAAAAAAALKQASALLHHQQQRSHSFTGCSLQSPHARALHSSPSMGSPAAAVAAVAASAGSGGSPCSSSRHQHSSTAAALLAAAADPALVLEYARAHKQQQQQHQACMAAVAAATAAGSPRACPQSGGQQKHVTRKQGLNPAAMAKLRQLMALQQQQIQVQQVSQTGGFTRNCLLAACPVLCPHPTELLVAPLLHNPYPFCLWLVFCALQELLALL